MGKGARVVRRTKPGGLNDIHQCRYQDTATQADRRKESGPELEPITVMIGLYGLWVARVISQDAFFLGTQVCHRMNSAKVKQIAMSGETAQKQVVMLDGSLYSGPLSKDLYTYVEALQDLHFRGGLLNNIVEPGEEMNDLMSHFTLSPTMTAGRHYSFKTPVYFRMFPMSKPEFLQRANTLAAENLDDCQKLELRKP